ncbi:hypothetical protein H4219_005760 [Mycoemilia scoparia]|uniref:Exocyst complex component Sec3 PIP2-binding N-terminal domain-containing protein n=1 Tax=Mycoemilia scoparia TaxID=417184 RepID=A0A9W8DPG0_9FUNG|nr:hypothetical protein H4219_005760 [Mycoemilia scoparia]
MTMHSVEALYKQLKEDLFIGIERKKLLPSGSYQERLLNLLPVTESNKDERIICITLKANRTLCLRKLKKHKSSYEVTKSWKLHEVKEICFEEPTLLKLTITRKYIFSTKDAALTKNFVGMLINFCQKYTTEPPRVIDKVNRGIKVVDHSLTATGGGGGGGSAGAGTSGVTARGATGGDTVTVGVNLRKTNPGRISTVNGGNSNGGTTIGYQKTLKQGAQIVHAYQSNQQLGTQQNPPRRSSLMFTSRPHQQQTTYHQHHQQVQKQMGFVHGGRNGLSDVQEDDGVNRSSDTTAVDMASGSYGGDLDGPMPGSGSTSMTALDVMDDFDDDFLLDQEFMLSADELLGKYGWKANIDADELESKLMNEMNRLESEGVQAMLESDQYVPTLLEKLDMAIGKLDNMDEILLAYTDELESMGDDVRKIRLENETLKIEEHNQKRLLQELENVLQKMALTEEDLDVLRNEPLKTDYNLRKVQYMAARLQRMLGDSIGGNFEDMGEAKVILEKYHMSSLNFTSRVYEYLKVMVQAETAKAMQKEKGLAQGIRTITIPESIHKTISTYVGFIIWFKDVNLKYYKEIQAMYVQSMNQVFKDQVTKVLDSCPYFSRSQTDTQSNDRFNIPATNKIASSLQGRRASLDVQSTADDQPSEEFSILIDTVITNVICEHNFIVDFFHLSDSPPPKFYDWIMSSMESIGNRKVPRPKVSNIDRNSQTSGGGATNANVVKGILDLIFGDLATRLDIFIKVGTKDDPLQAVGMVDEVEKWRQECDGTDQGFAIELLSKLRMKLLNIFNNYINEQIQHINQTKLTLKKRTGVASFVHVFPNAVQKLENLIGNTMTPARSIVNQAYDHISASIFKTLNDLGKLADQHVAKNTEDKDAEKEKINASIISLVNMDALIVGLKGVNYSSMSTISEHIEEAKRLYTENMEDYIKMLLKRPIGKIMDFFNEVEKIKYKNPSANLDSTQCSTKALQVLLNHHKPKVLKEGLRNMFKRIDKHMEETPKLRPKVYSHAKSTIHNVAEKYNGSIALYYSGVSTRFDFDISEIPSA